MSSESVENERRPDGRREARPADDNTAAANNTDDNTAAANDAI